MSKRDEQTEFQRAEKAFRKLGDALRRAAKNADALDLKPEVKAWLLDQFGPDHPRTIEIGTGKRLEYTREIIRQQMELEQQAIPPISDRSLETVRNAVRQQWELEQKGKPDSGKSGHVDTEHRRRKSNQDRDDLPPH